MGAGATGSAAGIPPCPGYGTQQTQALWPQLYTTAMNNQPNPVDPYFAYAIMAHEGVPSSSAVGGWATSPTGAQGPMQVEPYTANGMGIPAAGTPSDPNFVQANITAGVQYLGEQVDTFGDYALAASAYNGGPGIVQNGTVAPATAGYVGKVMQDLQGSSGTTSGIDMTQFMADDTNPVAAIPVYGMNISKDQTAAVMAAINPPMIITTGLNQPPWYANKNMVQEARGRVPVRFPVAFNLYFGSAGKLLTLPIVLRASMQSHQKSMRHVTTKQKTQTGLLVNLWGMALDQISGQASTGLMMNQLGMTDFLSMANVPSSVQNMIQSAMAQSSPVLHVKGGAPAIGGSGGALSQLSNQPDAMRIAAKDAFVEFLSLFKNNGNVWFSDQDSNGGTDDRYQVSPDAWSPITGSSTAQNAGNRNGVMMRGRVEMRFMNTICSGYFKNLSWVMDAKSPFRWNFTFVFQVERTSVNVNVPSLGSAPSLPSLETTPIALPDEVRV